MRGNECLHLRALTKDPNPKQTVNPPEDLLRLDSLTTFCSVPAVHSCTHFSIGLSELPNLASCLASAWPDIHVCGKSRRQQSTLLCNPTLKGLSVETRSRSMSQRFCETPTSQPLERALHPCPKCRMWMFAVRPISWPVPHLVLVAEGFRSWHTPCNTNVQLREHSRTRCTAQEDLYSRTPSSTSEDFPVCLSRPSTLYVRQCANGYVASLSICHYESLPEALKPPLHFGNDNLASHFSRQPKRTSVRLIRPSLHVPSPDRNSM